MQAIWFQTRINEIHCIYQNLLYWLLCTFQVEADSDSWIMYLLVEFTDNSQLAVVPRLWLEGYHCAVWPQNKSSTRLIKATIQKEPPTIRVLYKNGKY